MRVFNLEGKTTTFCGRQRKRMVKAGFGGDDAPRAGLIAFLVFTFGMTLWCVGHL